MTSIFTTFFYQPIFNLLVFIYNYIPDIGITIIVLTLIIKIVLYPLSIKSIKSQKEMQEIQPEIEAIKKKHKDQKEKQAAEMMKLYKEKKVSPFSSCLPLLIQLPFLIAVFWVFRNGLTNGSLDLVYSFIARPESINPIAFGFLDLSKSNIFLALLAGASQFGQAKMLSIKKPEINTKDSKDESMTAIMNKQMLYFMPILTIVIGMSLPGGLMLYWTINSIFTMGQQYFSFHYKNKKDNNDINSDTPIEGEIIK